MKNYIFLFLALVSSALTAQDLPMVCGEQCNHTDHDFESWLALRTSGNRESSNFTKYLPVAYHVFNGASTPEIIEESFAILQEQMEGTNIVPCRHNSNFYNEWDDLPTEDPIYDNPLYFQAMQANELAGTDPSDVCNIYVFNNLGGNISGFSWINQNPGVYVWDGIYIDAASVPTEIITHEMGHYCGLYHTFNGGQCTSQEDNCELQGDRVCDTPPTSVNYSCEEPYCPEADYTNHMDYTPNFCRDHFTPGQIERMHMLLVNGGRQTVWQSGACADPDLLDVTVLSVNNSLRCDEIYTPVVKLGNYSNIDADAVQLSVIMNNQQWDTIVGVPANSVQAFTGAHLQGEYLQEYVGEVFITLVGDNNPDNNVTGFLHAPLPHAVLNVDIQHDVWPQSEQWKVYKEGVVGTFQTGSNYYAQGGSWGPIQTYDSYEDGFTLEPMFTHDEFCLTGGCYGGYFRHFGYATTQELYTPDNPDYEGIVCGMNVYVDRGLERDTIYSYNISAWSEDGELNMLTEEDNFNFDWGWIHGNSWEYEYDYCVEDEYLDLLDSEETQNMTCPGDFNADGNINLNDFLAICGELGMEGECVCDMDGDADVDVSDFASFLTVYGTSCEGEELSPPTLRQLEELGLNPVLINMEGKRVDATKLHFAFGVYLAEIEINGMKHTIKVVK